MQDAPYSRARAFYEIDMGAALTPYDFWQERARFGYVYFLGELDWDAEPTKWLKIGVAADPCKRIRSLSTGNPRPLTYEALILGDEKTEKMLHRHFAGVMVGKSEWFGYGYRDAIIAMAREIDRRQRAAIDAHDGWLDDTVLRHEIVADVLAAR